MPGRRQSVGIVRFLMGENAYTQSERYRSNPPLPGIAKTRIERHPVVADESGANTVVKDVYSAAELLGQVLQDRNDETYLHRTRFG